MLNNILIMKKFSWHYSVFIFYEYSEGFDIAGLLLFKQLHPKENPYTLMVRM